MPGKEMKVVSCGSWCSLDALKVEDFGTSPQPRVASQTPLTRTVTLPRCSCLCLPVSRGRVHTGQQVPRLRLLHTEAFFPHPGLAWAPSTPPYILFKLASGCRECRFLLPPSRQPPSCSVYFMLSACCRLSPKAQAD